MTGSKIIPDRLSIQLTGFDFESAGPLAPPAINYLYVPINDPNSDAVYHNALSLAIVALKNLRFWRAGYDEDGKIYHDTADFHDKIAKELEHASQETVAVVLEYLLNGRKCYLEKNRGQRLKAAFGVTDLTWAIDRLSGHSGRVSKAQETEDLRRNRRIDEQIEKLENEGKLKTPKEGAKLPTLDEIKSALLASQIVSSGKSDLDGNLTQFEIKRQHEDPRGGIGSQAEEGQHEDHTNESETTADQPATDTTNNHQDDPNPITDVDPPPTLGDLVTYEFIIPVLPDGYVLEDMGYTARWLDACLALSSFFFASPPHEHEHGCGAVFSHLADVWAETRDNTSRLIEADPSWDVMREFAERIVDGMLRDAGEEPVYGSEPFGGGGCGGGDGGEEDEEDSAMRYAIPSWVAAELGRWARMALRDLGHRYPGCCEIFEAADDRVGGRESRAESFNSSVGSAGKRKRRDVGRKVQVVTLPTISQEDEELPRKKSKIIPHSPAAVLSAHHRIAAEATGNAAADKVFPFCISRNGEEDGDSGYHSPRLLRKEKGQYQGQSGMRNRPKETQRDYED